MLYLALESLESPVPPTFQGLCSKKSFIFFCLGERSFSLAFFLPGVPLPLPISPEARAFSYILLILTLTGVLSETFNSTFCLALAVAINSSVKLAGGGVPFLLGSLEMGRTSSEASES